jgi:hypothetical protein
VTSAAAAFEWTVSIIITFYYLTLAADLWPAGKSSARYMRRLAIWQEKHGEGDSFTLRGAFGEHPERWEDRAEDRAENRAEIMRREMYQRNAGVTTMGEEPIRMSEASPAGSQVPMVR